MSELDQVNKLLTEGFSALDDEATQAQQLKQQQEIYNEAAEVAGVFQSGAGRKILDKLKARFVDPPTWVALGTNIDDATAYGFSREGQKSVVQWILNCINVAEQGPPTQPKSEG